MKRLIFTLSILTSPFVLPAAPAETAEQTKAKLAKQAEIQAKSKESKAPIALLMAQTLGTTEPHSPLLVFKGLKTYLNISECDPSSTFYSAREYAVIFDELYKSTSAQQNQTNTPEK